MGEIVVRRVGDISSCAVVSSQRMEFLHALTDDLQQLLTLGIQHLAMGGLHLCHEIIELRNAVIPELAAGGHHGDQANLV